jgi:hypothetical protein
VNRPGESKHSSEAESGASVEEDTGYVEDCVGVASLSAVLSHVWDICPWPLSDT